MVNENNIINVHTSAEPGGLTINSGSDIKKAMDVTNNKARYYAELAKSFADEAKTARDDAVSYVELNSDVTKKYVDDIKDILDENISLKQDILTAGDGISIVNNIITNTKISAVWGNLTGNISSQTDLKDILDSKADSTTVTNSLNLKSDKTTLHALKAYEDAGELLTDPEGLADVTSYKNSSNVTGTDTYTINGSTVSIPYTLSKTGSKIVDSAYRTEVTAVYNEFGCAPYYTLSNSDFTLPMGEIYGMMVDKTTPHIVETYQNGARWYRVWSDGWCEQGGETSVSLGSAEVAFSKNYKDTDYSAFATELFNSNDTGGVSAVSIVSGTTNYSFGKSTTGLRISQANGNVYKTQWMTCGYIS